MEPISLIMGGISILKNITKIKGLFGSKSEKVTNAVSIIEDAVGDLKGKDLPPEMQLELSKATLELEKEMRKIDTDQMNVVAKTMVEYDLKAEHWPQWLWRPMYGFVSCGCFAYVVIIIVNTFKLAVKLKMPELMDVMPQFVFNIFLLFTIPGSILGITAYGRNKFKEAKENKQGFFSRLF